MSVPQQFSIHSGDETKPRSQPPSFDIRVGRRAEAVKDKRLISGDAHDGETETCRHNSSC